jgi:hypothetical protein
VKWQGWHTAIFHKATVVAKKLRAGKLKPADAAEL